MQNFRMLVGVSLTTLLIVISARRPLEGQSGAADAAAGFDGQSNGAISQADFTAARAVFEERDDIGKGLGPVYNAQGCVECHQNPITGGASQVTVLRAGHFDGSNFIEHPELIAQRIGRYAQLVGRENVIAGSDCGYGTWVGQAAVDPDIVWAKMAAMAEGARIASERFWPAS